MSISPRTATAAALVVALGTSVAAVPAAHADVAPSTGTVQYSGGNTTQGSGSTGSVENPLVQGGLVIIAGLAVSAALAIGAGISGGAIQLPKIPGINA